VFVLSNKELTHTSDQISFWVQSIHSCFLKSKYQIILVGTHVDEIMDSVEAHITALIREDPVLKNLPFICVSPVNGHNIKFLRRTICKILIEKKLVWESVPKHYLKMIEMVKKEQEMGSFMTTWRSFTERYVLPFFLYIPKSQLCDDNNRLHAIGVKRENAKKVARFLHNVGSIAYYENCEREDYLILNPNLLVTIFDTLV